MKYNYRKNQWSYQEKINKKTISNLFQYIKQNCNLIHLVLVSRHDDDVEENKLLDEIKPFTIKIENVTEWMGTKSIPTKNCIYSKEYVLEVKEEIINHLKIYSKLFKPNSAFDISIFHNNECHFYCVAHEGMFVYNLDVMSEFVKENYTKKKGR